MRPLRHLPALAVIVGGFISGPAPRCARAQSAASSARASLLVTPAWLAQHLHDPDLVLLHVGDKGEYASAHIAGARLVGLDEISVSDHSGKGLMLEMPAADSLRKDLAALGISDKSRIVVYYGKDWVTPATRVVFTLDFAGLGGQTSLLDGGMGAWTRAGNPVTDVVAAQKTGTLSALRERPIVVDAEYVRAHTGKPGISVVDGRAAVFYDGVQHGGGMGVDHRAGHIPGAKSVPYTEITTDQLLLKSPAELEALFTSAGVGPKDTVVGYCHIGQQATGMLFAARTLGHPVFLYDGSFEDWSRHTEFPVENPAEKKKP
jgi:thiosulfate/3-mercaptopyruvate sulfurtransferase